MRGRQTQRARAAALRSAWTCGQEREDRTHACLATCWHHGPSSGRLVLRRSWPRSLASVALLLLKEGLLDLAMDANEPGLRALGALAKMRRLGIGVSRPLFRG